jgi:hypothetical protein
LRRSNVSVQRQFTLGRVAATLERRRNAFERGEENAEQQFCGEAEPSGLFLGSAAESQQLIRV